MPAPDRIVWIDAARAVCVLAVVVMHATLSLHLDHVEQGAATTFWAAAVEAMTPFRMPGLAMLSGLLLASRIRAGWSAAGSRVSVASSVWLYAVWLLVFAIFAWATGGGSVWTSQVGGEGFAMDAVLRQLALPRTMLWYVFALALWTALLTSLRRMNPWLVLGALAAVSIASRYLALEDGDAQIRNVLRYAVFFAIGALGASRLRDAIGRGDRMFALGALWVLIATTGIVLISGNNDVEHVLSVPRDAAAAIVLLAVVASLCRAAWLGRALAWVGRRTLPVYVLHALLFDLVLTLVPGWDAVIDLPVLRGLAPLLIALLAAAAIIGLYELLRRTHMRFLFALPASVRQWLQSAPRRLEPTRLDVRGDLIR